MGKMQSIPVRPRCLVKRAAQHDLKGADDKFLAELNLAMSSRHGTSLTFINWDGTPTNNDIPCILIVAVTNCVLSDVQHAVGTIQYISSNCPLYDKRNDYNYAIVNSYFMDNNIPNGPAYGNQPMAMVLFHPVQKHMKPPGSTSVTDMKVGAVVDVVYTPEGPYNYEESLDTMCKFLEKF